MKDWAKIRSKILWAMHCLQSCIENAKNRLAAEETAGFLQSFWVGPEYDVGTSASWELTKTSSRRLKKEILSTD
jgi:hypothetical protein